MVQAGGPAAINGFLYQILKHLDWLASVHIMGRVSGADVPEDARIILEPKDGGDARLQGQCVYLVEQYKTRHDGTWSVQAIIDDILPDLRKAVPEPPPAEAEYRFVTDGREGRLENFRKFLATVQAVDVPEELDATTIYHFGEKLPNTLRGLFDHILSETKRASERERTDEAGAVLHLLNHFHMDFAVSAESSAEQVEKWLRPMCSNSGEEMGKRKELIGTLMEQLSAGETRIDVASVDKFLQAAGLNPESTRQLSLLDQTLRNILDHELANSGYNAHWDVREPPPWPAEKPILAITGGSVGGKGAWGSGEGKTWQLQACLREKAQADEAVVWLRWEKGIGVEATLARAANTVWQSGLNFSDSKTIVGLRNRYREMAPGATMPWLTIAIDNVQDKEAALELARQPLEDWGIRLAMSVPPDVAGVLQHEPGNRIYVHALDKFSIPEVDDLLSRHGRRWADLPSDLQQLLRVPILAGLYLQLPFGKFETAPHTEYEIFREFWKRMTLRCEPGDDGILTGIAGRVVEKSSYPLEKKDWGAIGLDASSLKRLQATGWLICRPGGLVEFAHDRLLNWAVAVEVVDSLKHGNRTFDQAAALLIECADNKHTRRLGYVPMDALWLLTEDVTKANSLADIIEKLEANRYYGSYCEDLYTHMLPTLGQRIVDALVARLNQLHKGDYRVKIIAQALTAITKQDGADLSDLTEQLMRSASIDRQFVGIELASARPSSCFLDRLWEMHKDRPQYKDCTTPEERKRFLRNYRDYETSFAALKACVAIAPEWLLQQIRHPDQDKKWLNQLAYLLNNLDHPSAPDIWSQVKDDLINKVSPDRPRSILDCIGRFRDLSLMGFLLSSLTCEEDFANCAALANLISFDPDMAIEHLNDIPSRELAMTRAWWLPHLLEIRPMEVRRKLLEMAGNDPKRRNLIDALFSDRADHLDGKMLRYYLRILEEELLRLGEITCRTDTNWLHLPLQLLNNISHPDLLAVLHEEADGQLESMLTNVACSRITGRSRQLDHVLEDCRQVLIRICGKGITRLLNHELRASEYWGRYGGVKWAYVAPDAQTIDLLLEIGRWPVTIDDHGNPNSDEHFERHRAIIALAAAGSDKGVVEAIWGEGPESVAIDLDKIRGTRGPLDKKLTKRSSEVLRDKNSSDGDVMKALSIAWLSKDDEILPVVRDVLKRANHDGQIAGMACFVLAELGDSSQQVLQLALPMLKTDSRRLAMNALLSLGDAAYPHLLAHLEEVPFEKWTQDEVRLAEVLCRYVNTQVLARKWAVRLCREPRALIKPYSLGVQSGEADIREVVIEKAFNANGFVVGEKSEEIKALKQFDPERAIAATVKQLRITRNELRSLAKLLAHLTPDDAAALLVDVARYRKDSLAAVGHALRTVNAEQVDAALIACLQDSSRDVRAVGAELAGWQPPGRLLKPLEDMLGQEPEPNVRKAAIEALERKRQQRIALNLLQAFEEAEGPQRWAFLLALLEMADPYLLSDSDDSLWIGAALDKAPYIFWRHAKKALKERKSKIK